MLISLTTGTNHVEDPMSVPATIEALQKLGPLPIIVPLQRSLLVRMPDKHERAEDYRPFEDNLPTIQGMFESHSLQQARWFC
jgi:hypothetical protein